MAYTGSGVFGGIRFNDAATAAAYQKGQGYYTTMPGINPNEPGWGDLVPEGYELVGYKAPKMSGHSRSGNRAPVPGTDYAILRKRVAAPAPAAVAPAPQAPPPQAAPPPPAAPPPSGPSPTDLMLQSLQESIAAMQQSFMESIQQNAQQFQQMQQAQNAQMAELQQAMMQSLASQAERPTVAGVKTATGQSGTPMQIARRGVSGAFGRRGMRISSLNL